MTVLNMEMFITHQTEQNLLQIAPVETALVAWCVMGVGI